MLRVRISIRTRCTVQHYVIKFVSDLRQVGGFLRSPVSSTNKTDRHDITEILLKVALNTIKQSNKQTCTQLFSSEMGSFCKHMFILLIILSMRKRFQIKIVVSFFILFVEKKSKKRQLTSIFNKTGDK